MKKTEVTRDRASRLRFLSKVLIIVGVCALITPYVLRYVHYQASVVLALEVEDSLGELSDQFDQVDYSQLKIAALCVYTPEEIDAAQHSPSFFDDFIGHGDDSETTGTEEESTATSTEIKTIKEGSYLLEIPAISLKISAIRCRSFERIYRCMRLGAAIFPKAPEPNEIGNICMSAHRTGSRDYFRNLDQLSVGNTIYLHYTKNVSYQYQVVSVSIIEPDDWSVTGQTLYPALTLLSCQEYQGVSHGRRIMVRAKLVSVSR